MSKKIILAFLILVIIGGVGYFVWINKGPGEMIGDAPSGFSFKNFFPFGNSEEATGEIVSDPNQNTGSSTEEELIPIANNEKAPKLRKVSNSPVAGMAVFDVGTTTYVRYIEKATGNVYEAKGDSLNIKRLTNTTIPKITRAFWLPKGEGVLVQTVDESDLIETSFISLKAIKATSTENLVPYDTVISKLPTGIEEISISPDGKKIIYYIKTGISDWYTSNPDGTGKKNVYQNSIQNWVPEWYSTNSILLTTKASAAASSYIYSLNISNNQFSKILGNIAGASAKISPNGKNILVSVAGDRPVLKNFTIASSSNMSIGSYTLSEKCAWDVSDMNFVVCGMPKSVPISQYPDNWYKGLISTADTIQRINVNDNFVYTIAEPIKEAGEEVDVKEIKISPKGNYATFINRQDSSLWLLKIKD